MDNVLVSLVLTLNLPLTLTVMVNINCYYFKKDLIARISNLNFLLKVGALKISEKFLENTSVRVHLN